ncbi:hypothetical protein HYH02_001421 [Chlamydomonas schloesseri]|uniref:Right handed beta helix domain-containing protein n=1 Tax=Chlamydomonas schloesseri TaxID=2026947 RepID=A0A835WWD5_9CHLO|nr:hypothetical protein HYH02_001421 [Chlamydomonas schloesseri]|eukprot:KAG2454398.1 hypothetical protein HYH02_001421 [Chlamydomonas schloesseri]
MGAGCSSAAPEAAAAHGAEAVTASGPQPGHVYLSFHRADTGEQKGEGGDGAAGRIRDWLTSKGYVVLMGERDDDADGGKKVAGVQQGPAQVWFHRMQRAVESCQAFVAVCSERYGTGAEAHRELQLADGLGSSSPGLMTLPLIPLWHSGPWPPPQPHVGPLLAHLERVPHGTRPLCRTVLEGVMGELLDRLQGAGVMPAPNAVDGAAAAAAAGRTSAYTADVEWCFQPGPQDPKEQDYALVKCYTRQLQEIMDRLSLTVRPTVLDLGGETYSGDLPHLVLVDAAAAAAAVLSGAGRPAVGGTLLLNKPHVTLRNGCIKLRQDQELRILSPGVVLDRVSVITEPRQAGGRVLSTNGELPQQRRGGGSTYHGGGGTDHGGGSTYHGGGGTYHGGGGTYHGGGGTDHGGGSTDHGGGSTEHGSSGTDHGGGSTDHGGGSTDHGGVGGGGSGMVGYGAVYEMGRAMVVMAAGAVGLRAFNCQFTNHGPHLALWLAAGATAAFQECQVEAPDGGGVWVRDAGSVLVGRSCHFQNTCGPCLQVEAGAGAQLVSCTVANSSMHVGLMVGSGCRVRADKCVVSGNNQTGVSIYGGATVELVGCEAMGNSQVGVEVREPGTTLTAIDCKLTQNNKSGLLVAQGGSARLTSCGAGGNRTHGVLVRGEGSFAALRQVTLSHNNQAGVMVNSAAKVDLVNCEAIGNKMCALIVLGAGAQAVAADCKFNTNMQAGMAVKDGGRCELTRCVVRGNKLPSEVAGAGSWLGTRGCTIDAKPVVARGGLVEGLRA